MGRAHVRAHGTVPPDRFVAALVDFGPRRSEVWGNSDPGHLAVHDRGDFARDLRRSIRRLEGSPAPS
jgi:hypothetical protein